METKLSWYDSDQTILLIEVSGQPASWDELPTVVETQQVWLDAITHQAHTIFDLRRASSRVPRGNALLAVKKLMDYSHPNEDLTILLGRHVILRPLIEIVDRAYRMTHYTSRYRYVDTMQQALDAIKRYEAAKRSQQS